jgi:hypothetical protein
MVPVVVMDTAWTEFDAICDLTVTHLPAKVLHLPQQRDH